MLWFMCLILDKIIMERNLWVSVHEVEVSMKSELWVVRYLASLSHFVLII